jgi:hypothetical protein
VLLAFASSMVAALADKERTEWRVIAVGLVVAGGDCGSCGDWPGGCSCRSSFSQRADMRAHVASCYVRNRAHSPRGQCGVRSSARLLQWL